MRRDDDGRMYQCGATNENGTTLSTIGRINGKETSETEVYVLFSSYISIGLCEYQVIHHVAEDCM